MKQDKQISTVHNMNMSIANSKIKSLHLQEQKPSDYQGSQEVRRLSRLLQEKGKQYRDLKTEYETLLFVSSQKIGGFQNLIRQRNELIKKKDDKVGCEIKNLPQQVEKMSNKSDINQLLKLLLKKEKQIHDLKAGYITFMHVSLQKVGCYQTLRRENQELRSKVSLLEKQKVEAKSYAELKELIKQIPQEIQKMGLSSQSSMLKEKMQQLELENIRMKEKQLKNETKISHLTSIIQKKGKNYKSTIFFDEINNNGNQTNNEKIQNIEKNEELQKKLCQFKQQNNQLLQQFEKTYNELKEAKKKCKEIETQLKLKEIKYNETQENFSQLEQKLKNLQSDFEKLSNQNILLKQRNDEMSEQIVRFKKLQQCEVQQQKYYRERIMQLQTKCPEVKQSFEKKISQSKIKEKEKSQLQQTSFRIGRKLITSLLLHGLDRERHQIICKIEEFTGKTIRKTDFLMRFPLTKSMIHQIKEEFPFLLMYRTKNNIVVGSYSDGLRKPTFIFAFKMRSEKELKIQEQIQRQEYLYFSSHIQDHEMKRDLVKFCMPEGNKGQMKVQSIDIFQKKYLQYGNGELRINCIDMTHISANSDATGELYYNLDWVGLFQEKNQGKIPLAEVELHQVYFMQS